MLSSKLVTGEVSIPKMAPENPFAVGRTRTEITGMAH